MSKSFENLKNLCSELLNSKALNWRQQSIDWSIIKHLCTWNFRSNSASRNEQKYRYGNSFKLVLITYCWVVLSDVESPNWQRMEKNNREASFDISSAKKAKKRKPNASRCKSSAESFETRKRNSFLRMYNKLRKLAKKLSLDEERSKIRKSFHASTASDLVTRRRKAFCCTILNVFGGKKADASSLTLVKGKSPNPFFFVGVLMISL